MIALLESADLWFRALQSGTALLLVALGGYLLWRSGILNIGMEGGMLAGCFGAVLVDDKTHSAWLGMLGGAGAGVLASCLLGILVISFRAHAIIVGLALNFLMAGLTALALQAIYGVQGAFTSPNLRSIPRVRLPLIDRVPWLGPVLSGHTVVTYLAWMLGLAIPWWLKHSRGGLTVRVAGARPDVVRDVGRSVHAVQWSMIVASGLLIGLGGAQLALGESTEFAEGMTSGRGFIALALIIIAGRSSWLLLPLALGFGFFDTLGLSLQLVGLPSEFSGVVPYAAILAALLVARLPQLLGRRGTASPALTT